MTEGRQVPTDPRQENDHTGRREALQKMGKYAAYTAPTLIALTLPEEGHAKQRRRPRPHVSGR
jgi:hypothetical protein